MSIQKTIKSYILLGLLLVSSSSYSYDDDFLENAGAAALLVGGVAAGAYGLYKFFDWCCTPSNESLLDSGDELYHQAHYRFQPIMNHLCEIESVHPCEYYYDHQWVHHNEAVLQKITSQCFREKSIHTYLSIINDFTRQMRNKIAEINGRIIKLESDKQYSKYVYICDQLQKTANKLSEKNSCLETIYGYLKMHKNYVGLWQTMHRLAPYYERECELADTPMTMINFLPNLMACAMSHANISSAKYILLKYAEKINVDCRDLHNALVDTGLYSCLNKRSDSIVEKT